MNTSQDWVKRALCATPEYADKQDQLWFADPGKQRPAVTRAVRLCYQCPVREECLTDALTAEGNAHKSDRHGVRGGLTPYQRRLLHEELARRAAGAAA